MLEVLLFLCQYELLSWIFRIWIFMPQLRRITLKLCQVALRIKNSLFYHLPTRGRAGIKLGDAWYVSNVSIIFYCSMLYYLLFWMFMGFIIHFYIIFGTNLLTQSPMPVSVFTLFQGFEEKENQTESNWPETSRNLFLDQKKPRRLGVHAREASRRPRGRGALPPPLWAPHAPPDVLLPPIYLHIP